MSGEDEQPAWVSWIREDIAALNRRMDVLVTTESFRQEQHRVNEKFDGLGREIGQNRVDIQAEAQARVAETLQAQKDRAAETAAQSKVAAQTRWQWFALFAVPIGAWLVSQILPSIP